MSKNSYMEKSEKVCYELNDEIKIDKKRALIAFEKPHSNKPHIMVLIKNDKKYNNNKNTIRFLNSQWKRGYCISTFVF